MRELTPALGPYAHFTCYDSLVFASGQIPIDADGKVYSDAPIDVQTRLALENLSAVFEAAGTSLQKALKVNIYLRCLDDFAAMNEVYKSFFPQGVYPARCCVEVSRLTDGIAIEIDGISHM